MGQTKLVFAVSVTTKHFMADWFQWLKNMLGMNLTTYEDMVAESVEQAIYKLKKAYPKVYAIRLVPAMITTQASAMIAYGKVKIESKRDKNWDREEEDASDSRE